MIYTINIFYLQIFIFDFPSFYLFSFMNTPDIKPKVVVKNLQDIIKENAFRTKRTSIENLIMKQQPQRHLKTEPRQKKNSQRCNTSVSYINRSKDTSQTLHNSMSKHSLLSKEKINFIDASKVTLDSQKYKQKNHLKNSPNKQSSKNIHNPKQKPFLITPATRKPATQFHSQSLYFNQVDAIFTELQDFLRQTRQKICLNMNVLDQIDLNNMFTNQLGELVLIFQEEMDRLLKKCLGEDKLQNMRYTAPAQKNCKKQHVTIKPFEGLKAKQVMPKQQEKQKIEQFMQRQNTVYSTVLSQSHEDNMELPKQTETELLSILMFKNKMNNTKRKYQNNQQKQPFTWSKKQHFGNETGEYSFRGKNIVNQVSSDSKKGSVNHEVDRKKKQYGYLGTEKSSCKQNREKSIYQMVLEENNRMKIGNRK